MEIVNRIAQEFSIQAWQVENTVKLLDEGNTVPFIARYRKEAHGTLDDQTLREISERLEYLRNLEKRREEVRASIEAQEKLTEEVEKALNDAKTLAEIEDVYRPYKPKRKTRASVAREKGLEPLAEKIFEQAADSLTAEEMAQEFATDEMTAEEALQGAMDIIAEDISDNANIRRRIRNLFTVTGTVTSKAADEETDSVYRQYYEYEEPVKKIAGHRVLAIDRGEREGMLKVKVNLETAKAENVIRSEVVKEGSPCTETVIAAGSDAYERLINPSVEREIRADLTEKAATSAIKVFATNLRQLLLQPPIKDSVVLGLDPGYRTGCKTAVVDKTGKVLATDVLYLTHSQAQKDEAEKKLLRYIDKFGVDVIAIGNGTASKETEIFTAQAIKKTDREVAYMVVSEAGASVYSASKLAAEEFPDYDVSLRSAVSIARRLQDPLAELVKIDPKSIGVGQYQHDMPKKELSAALDGVVEDCVNSVGVNLNTASPSLLSRVAGINSTVAKNIVKYREEKGAFTERKELKKVAKLGDKAFEQCAGFLRIPGGKNLLDNTGVHPESYDAANKLIALCEAQFENGFHEASEKFDDETIRKTAEALGIGEPTLRDIIKELSRPGRDPREELPPAMLRTDIMDIKDLKKGMELKGTVRNVIDFGAFVDIGVHQDGLVHIKQITDRFIRHPSEELKVGDIVTVWVLDVDVQRNRISLTMKKSSLG